MASGKIVRNLKREKRKISTKLEERNTIGNAVSHALENNDKVQSQYPTSILSAALLRTEIKKDF